MGSVDVEDASEGQLAIAARTLAAATVLTVRTRIEISSVGSVRGALTVNSR